MLMGRELELICGLLRVVLFIDLDSVVLKNLDFLFSYPELTVSNDQAAVPTPARVTKTTAH